MENDPTHWTFNLFYFNREDSRIFVPKRNPGMGLTVNFARPLSWLITALIVLIPVTLIIFLK